MAEGHFAKAVEGIGYPTFVAQLAERCQAFAVKAVSGGIVAAVMRRFSTR
jgi:hypothetical protein